MKLLILSCAEQEFAEAVDYYNSQGAGLGYEFAAEVQHSFTLICSYPQAWPLFSPQARRCLVNRFPYGILYRAKEGEILVGAIMHLKRSPLTWKMRAAL